MSNQEKPRCIYCGSDHSSESCHMKQWADYLTGESDTAPEGRTLIVTDENDLIDAVEEAHALKHIKTNNQKESQK